MGIYIPNLKKPNDCRLCPFMRYEIDCGRSVCVVESRILADRFKVIPFDAKLDLCPLIEIEQPHGKLIDVDSIEPDAEWDALTDGYISYSQVAIDCAETVLDPED